MGLSDFFLSEAARWIGLNTVTDHSNLGLIVRAERLLLREGFAVRRQKVVERGTAIFNLLARRGPETGKPLLLNTHTDTVPPGAGELWTSTGGNPFRLTRSGGYLHGLGVESAEALAEFFHRELRREWGIAAYDASDVRKLFKGHYRGCRYAFGYPACPRLEDQQQLFELIEPQRIGLELSEQFQLEPEQSTTAIVFHHPEAKYFNVAR